MTVSSIIDQIQANLNRSDATEDLILTWLNQRQRAICNIDNFTFMERTATTTTIPGQQTYSLPLDFKDELHLYLVINGRSKFHLIKWVGSEAEKSYTQVDTQGRPYAYWVWNDAYWLYPIPNDEYTLALKYYAYLEDLTNINDEPNELTKNWANLLIYGATAEGFHYFMQPDKAGEWETKYTAELQKLIRKESKEIYSNVMPRIKIKIK